MTNSPSTGRKWKPVVLIQLILLPVLFIAADVIVGLKRGYDADETRIYLSEVVESMQSGIPQADRDESLERILKADLRLHPYLGFGPKRLLASHNEEFEYLKSDAPEDEYRIMMLGGSVAEGFGNKGGAAIKALRSVLIADPRFKERKVRFISQGFGSYKQPQQLNLANYLLSSGVVPHAIISLDGFNEVALSMQNGKAGMNPAYPSYSQWIHLATSWGSEPDQIIDALYEVREARTSSIELAVTADRYGLLRSSILGGYIVERVLDGRRAFDAASKHYSTLLVKREGFGPLAGPAFTKDPELIVDSAINMWVESTRSLNALCELRGIFFMNVLQPTLHDKGSKVLTDDEIRKGKAPVSWVKGVALGYPKLREEGRRLQASGLSYLDASMAFLDIEEELYHDPCHFNQMGYKALGTQIGIALLAELPKGELAR